MITGKQVIPAQASRTLLSVLVLGLALVSCLEDTPPGDENGGSSGETICGKITSPGTPVASPAITAGLHHTMALRNDGTVWAWGSNSDGQLGNGTLTDCSAPAQVTGLTNVIAIASGDDHGMALRNGGTVWTWGNNTSGQLGIGTTAQSATPVQVKDSTGSGFLTDVKAIAAGGSHSIALKSDGMVWAWGYNFSGQLGDGTTTVRTAPVPVVGLAGVIPIAAGGSHSLASKSDGTVWAWGYNFSGQLGDGTTIENQLTPVPVVNLTQVSAIAAGNNHTIALENNRTVWAWGNNSQGQLGNGTNVNRNVPVQVFTNANATAIAISAGFNHTLVLKNDNTVWTWGDNFFGQLGDGTTTDQNSPVQVTGLTGVLSVAGGGSHSIALKSDGSLWAWGENQSGQLGDGTLVFSRTTPVQVTGLDLGP